MDFNDIKNTWKNSFDKKEMNQEEIVKRLTIKSKSSTVLEKLKKNYFIEMIFSGVIFFIIVGWLFFKVPFNEVYLVILLLCIIFGPFFLFAFKSFSNISLTNISTSMVKDALAQKVEKIDRYVRFGTSKLYKFVLMPLSMFIGMLLSIYVSSGEVSFITSVTEMGAKKITALFIAIFVGSVILVPLSQLFAKKMYKRHLDELKTCLSELEELDDNAEEIS